MSLVWAVISTFGPDERALDAVRSLREQVMQIVVVDDGSGTQADAALDALSAEGCRVIRLPENRGIAAALNTGIRVAIDEGAEAVITFDQDSVPEPGFVDALVGARDAAVRAGLRVGATVPEFFAGVRQVHREDPSGVLLARNAIQSGMLVEARVIDELGLLREDLFIDLVDVEYVLRAATAGYVVAAAPGLRLAHTLGRRYVQTLFGRPLRVLLIPAVLTLSTPFRYYYRVRNRLVINRLYGRRHRGWIARDTLVEALHFANAWWVARPRRAFRLICAAAIADARAGRTGRMPADIAAIAETVSWNAPRID